MARPRRDPADAPQPIMMSLRIPADLHAAMLRYGDLYRLTSTELLVEGLRWRLQQPDAQLAPIASTAAIPAIPVSQMPTPVDMPPQDEDYDPERFMLGPLCKQQHDYRGTGQSVRQIGGKHECRTCSNARKLRHKHKDKV